MIVHVSHASCSTRTWVQKGVRLFLKWEEVKEVELVGELMVCIEVEVGEQTMAFKLIIILALDVS